MTSSGIVERVKRAAAERLLFLPHAVRQMARPEGMITPGEIREIIQHGELIEDYPEDAVGHSCLLPPPWPRKREGERDSARGRIA